MPSRPLSPIERAIDAACGLEPGWDHDPLMTSGEVAKLIAPSLTPDEMGKLIAHRVFNHIDSYYKSVGQHIPPSPRRSITGVIRNAVAELAPRLHVDEGSTTKRRKTE